MLSVPAPVLGQAVLDTGAVALTNVTLIDGTGQHPRRNASVIVSNGRIARIGDAGDANVERGARTIDLAGKWLLPGFIDVHAHLPSEGRDPRYLARFLAYGVTAIRSPSNPETALRDSIDAGTVLGPTLRVAGILIDGEHSVWAWSMRVRTEAEMRAMVRRQAADKVDFIKLYVELSPDLVRAGIDEAHRLGLPVIGHLGKTRWQEAAEAGIDQLTHSWFAGFAHDVVPSSELARFRGFFVPNAQFDPSLFTRWNALVRADSPEILRLGDRLRGRRISFDPNLVLAEAIVRGDDPAALDQLEPSLLTPDELAALRQARHPYSATWSPDQMTDARRAFAIMQRAMGTLHQRGVRLTVGTDNLNPWVTPGVPFHRELELLVGAGIPPLQVLTIATRNGAEALGLLAQTGTIEAGKRADFVVLDADPLLDIRNSRRIDRIFLGGRELKPSALLNPSGVRELRLSRSENDR